MLFFFCDDAVGISSIAKVDLWEETQKEQGIFVRLQCRRISLHEVLFSCGCHVVFSRRKTVWGVGQRETTYFHSLPYPSSMSHYASSELTHAFFCSCRDTLNLWDEMKEKGDTIRKEVRVLQVGVYILKPQLRSFRYHGNSPIINSHTAPTPSAVALQERTTLRGRKFLVAR